MHLREIWFQNPDVKKLRKKFQKMFRCNNFNFSHRFSGLVVWFSLRVRWVRGAIPGCPNNIFSYLKNSTLPYYRRKLIKLIKRSYQMLEANFLTIAHIDQKGISKTTKIYPAIRLILDWRMSYVLPALFCFK